MKSSKKSYEGLLSNAKRLHEERVVFEAYMLRRAIDRGVQCNLLFNVEHNPPQQKYTIGNTVDESNYYHYCDQSIQLLWEGWELANEATAPLHLLPIKTWTIADFPERFDVDTVQDYSAYYGTSISSMSKNYSKVGDYIEVSDLRWFISRAESSGFPASTILHYINQLVDPY